MSGNKAKELDTMLTRQEFADGQTCPGELDDYKCIARGYAMIENVISVLSDMRTYTSYIYYGGFAERLGIDCGQKHETVLSIWEENILGLIHPDDLPEKYLHELCFFRFIKSKPPSQCHRYCLASRLRMRDAAGNYVPVLHRLHYIQEQSRPAMRFALCLYGPVPADFSLRCAIVNTVNARMTELHLHGNGQLLSCREAQVLTLIDKGLTSKDIAETLAISVNTVSRHRQNILDKLQAKSSIEACHVAKSLKII